MKIYDFRRDGAQAIQKYGSHDAFVRHIVARVPDARIEMMYIDAGGVLGFHQAASDQLFLVVQGSGWVTGTDRLRRSIEQGQAAFWEDGEWHESGSEAGMTALIVQAQELNPELPS